MKQAFERGQTILWLLVLGGACAAGNLGAFHRPDHPELPDLDLRLKPAVALPSARAAAANQLAAVAPLQARVPALKVELDPITGAPRSIASPQSFLSGPNGVGLSISKEVAARFADADPHRALKAFLTEHAALFGHGPEVLATAALPRDYVTAHNGLRTTVWAQRLDGLDVFEAVLISHVTKRGELVNLASQFLPDLEQAVAAGAPDRAALLASPPVTAPRALGLALQHLGRTVGDVDVRRAANPLGAAQAQRLTAPGVRGSAEARLVWLPMNRATLRLCWEVTFCDAARGETFRALLDAHTGRVLLRRRLTVYLTNATYRVFPSDSPSPFTPGHFTPSSAQPPLAARSLIVTSALNSTASPNGWIDDAVNETRGNNVDAHLDRDANDQPDLPRPQGAPFRVFDFPLDLTQPPTSYSAASVVQLFYHCNWMHDKLWELGFTETAGNFQNNNFGRGGLGNDAIQVDAQDGDGFNNANYTPTRDGTPARIQMFLFNGPNPDRDGDLDTEIVLHEYAHGLTDRLVGGGVGISALQSGGMGEGWSDWYGLALLSEPGDDPGGCYAVGGYATYRFFGLDENYYYGIRRYPYSTNLLKNPLTLKDIDPSKASDHPGIPRSPIGGGSAAEVHNQGEVWCAALWEVRANLVARHGFAAGNLLALRLVTDGLKLSPANPNFVQARDAILQADLVFTGGANRLEIWAGFAKRGLGFNAIAPSSSTTTGVEENFDLPDDLMITPLAVPAVRGLLGGPFTPAQHVLRLTNSGAAPLTWSADFSGLFQVAPALGSLAPRGTPGASVTVTARLSSAVSSLPSGAYRETLVFSNHTSGITQRRNLSLQVGGRNYFTELFEATANDLDNQTFTFTPDGSPDFYSVCRSNVSAFPTPPAGTVVDTGDDGAVRMNLTGGNTVSLYGVSYDRVYVSGNGYLTFTSADFEFSESLGGHFAQPRVAGLFLDLDSSLIGSILWQQLADRIVVTYDTVPQFATVRLNSLQIEMFFDGRIRLTYLRLDSTEGLAGLSAGGGVPADFTASDFSAFSSCLPSLTLHVPSEAIETDGVLAGQGRVSIAQALANNVSIALSSSAAALVRVPTPVVITAGQTQVSFDLTLTDNALRDGTRLARFTANATGFRSAAAFIHVHDNEAATLAVTLPPLAREGDGLLSGAGLVTIDPTPDRDVVISLAAAPGSELQPVPPGVVIVPAGQSSARISVQVDDDEWLDGPQTGTILARVQGWTSGSASMTVLDNESTNLSVVLPALVSEGNGRLANAGEVRLAGLLRSNLVLTLTADDATELSVPATVTVRSNEHAARFDLTVVDDPDLDGSQSVRVMAGAPGFAAGAATLIVADNEMPSIPFKPEPPDLATNVPADTRLSWGTGEGEQIVNGDFETGDFTGWSMENSGNGAFIINNGTFDPESADGPLLPGEGRFSALAQQAGTGRHALVQEISVTSGATFATLRWADRVRNHAPEFATHQQFRVEVRDTNHALLQVVFATQPGDLLLNDWQERTVDLGAFRGQTIRLAFVVEDALGFLNVHLDRVSVRLGAPLSTSHLVFFGTNPVPGAAEFRGAVSNGVWTPPSSLAELATYYWQVVAQRGSVQVTGPVWRFTTRGGLVPRTFLPLGAVWRFLDDGTDQNTGWRELGFNDAAWRSGPARLGYGGDGEATSVRYGSDPNRKFITTYFRHSFLLTNAADVRDLSVRLVRDDGAVVYLNGTEVFRSNMPDGPVDYLTLASATVSSASEQAFFTNSANATTLREGTNVLAAEVHQAEADSSDLGFNLELLGAVVSRGNRPPTARMTNLVSYAVVALPTNVLVQADASDPDGTVRKVEFFLDGNRVSEDLTPPFLATLVQPPLGSHVLTAVATDNLGLSAASPPVPILVVHTRGTLIPLVPLGSRWSYLDDGSDQGTAWIGTNFNDRAWLTGPAQLGYGDGDEATLLSYGPDLNNKYITTYFRQEFVTAAQFGSLNANLLRDDGAVLYLNGYEIRRENLPTGAINYRTLASSAISGAAESALVPFTVPPAYLVRGKNVLAAEIHQSSPTSSDISFDFELTGIGNYLPNVRLTAPPHNSLHVASQPLTLRAEAADAYGRVTKVEFFDGATRLGQAATEPFDFVSTPLTPGLHTFTAVATDNHGGTNRSATVNVTIIAAPTLGLERTGGGFALSWPSDPAGFAIEVATNLIEPVFWYPVTNGVIDLGERLRLPLEPHTLPRFFRLTRPELQILR